MCCEVVFLLMPAPPRGQHLFFASPYPVTISPAQDAPILTSPIARGTGALAPVGPIHLPARTALLQ